MYLIIVYFHVCAFFNAVILTIIYHGTRAWHGLVTLAIHRKREKDENEIYLRKYSAAPLDLRFSHDGQHCLESQISSRVCQIIMYGVFRAILHAEG